MRQRLWTLGDGRKRQLRYWRSPGAEAGGDPLRDGKGAEGGGCQGEGSEGGGKRWTPLIMAQSTKREGVELVSALVQV